MKQLFVETSAVLGSGQVLSEWDCRDKYLAVVGGNYRVRIYNRSGNVLKEFALISKNRVMYLDWDNLGETLAVSQENESIIVLYDISISKLTKLNTDLKKITWLSWNRGNKGNILSVGSSKGNLLLYNKLTFRKQIIMGKHSKKILYGSWNISNKLGLVGKDKKLTISDINGNTINENYLKQYPRDLQFGLQMSDNKGDKGGEEDTITMNMNGKTIYMYFINNPSQPIELAFQAKYGDIICYKWYGDGYILAGFSKGFIVSISTHEKEMGEEIHSLRIDHKSIVSISIHQCYAAVSTNKYIKIIDLNTWKENEYLSCDSNSCAYGIPTLLNWSSDGQILCINTNCGNLLSYLVKTNKSIDIKVYKDKNIAYLSSLQQISIITNYLTNAMDNKNKIINITIEPKLIGIGLNHIVVTFNNHCWCYTFDNILLFEYDFISEIQDIKLNETHLCALVDNKIFIISLHNNNNNNKGSSNIEPFVFNINNEQISGFSLTSLFVICASKTGILYQMYLENYKLVNETKHNKSAIGGLYPNHNGTITVFIDSSNYGYLYNPVTDTKLKIDKFSSTIKQIFWDKKNTNIFYGYDINKNIIYSFVYNAQTLRGAIVEYIDITTLNKTFKPILIINGIVIGFSDNICDNISENKIEYKILNCYESLYEHTHNNNTNNTNTADISKLISITQFSQTRKCFYQLMSLHFLQYAYFISLRLNQRELWIALSKKCLELLNIDLAISVFRSLQNASSVLLLNKLKNENDLFLVSGHCCTLLNDFETAQKLFLLSNKPICALKMRCNLLQFDKALVLCQQMENCGKLLPKICFEYAQQLEFKQKYTDSLQMYEKAQKHEYLPIDSCLSGIIRCTLRIGYIQKGVQLALSSKNTNLQYECANLLQSMKQYNESGQLFIECNQITKAVNCFIISKNFDAVKPLINKISTPSLHIKYAKEMELIKQYKDALNSYNIANDKLSIIRLYLYHIPGQIDKAINLVRNNPFIEGAKIIAKFALNKRDIMTCIEFLVLSKNFNKAFDLAKSYNYIDIYKQYLDENQNKIQFKNIAEFYILNKPPDFANAAQCYLKSSLFQDALINFIKAKDGINEYLDDVLNIIRQGNNDKNIINIILEYINNNNIENKTTLFRLYLAIGDINLATKMSIDISAQQQRMGKYQNAHQIVFEMIQELSLNKIKNKQLSSKLLLLHTYLLVKLLIKKNDNYLATKMLIRVCDSISKFPSHTVQILTSTVIQCQKTGFYKYAIEYANYLMRPEYRKQIMVKYKKKIEYIVRHSYKKQQQQRQEEKEEKDEEEVSECPYCKVNIPSTTLYCKSCKNNIPYCIITGKHMVLNDWTYCPSCSFPALYTYFVHHIENGFDSCPMCRKQINANQITLHSHPVI